MSFSEYILAILLLIFTFTGGYIVSKTTTHADYSLDNICKQCIGFSLEFMALACASAIVEEMFFMIFSIVMAIIILIGVFVAKLRQTRKSRR